MDQVGDAHAAEQIDEIAADVAALGSAHLDEARAIGRRLLTLAAELAPATASIEDVDLNEISDLARSAATRAAQTMNSPVLIEVAPHAEGAVPRRLAVLLADVLGQVVRDAIQFGAPLGGSLRVTLERPDAALVVVVSERADRIIDGAIELARERAAMLQTTQARVAAAGGELATGGGAWGGTSVTLRLPVAQRQRSTRWTHDW